jgi:microcystin-dependent protein
MAAINFPNTPTAGDKWPSPPVAGIPVYTFDGEKWTTQGGAIGTGGAPLDSPHFTGDPQAPTPPPGDNDVSIATTAFVAAAIAAGISGISGFATGDVKLTLRAVADSGWVIMNDGTITKSGSGGTAMADDSCHALYVLIWTNVNNTYAPVTGGRTTAEGDWTAGKALALTKVLGRTLAIAGAGAALTARALGQTLGEENHTLVASEVPNLSYSGGASVNVSGSVYIPDGQAMVNATLYGGGPGTGGGEGPTVGGINIITGALTGSFTGSGSGSSSGGTTSGGGGVHNTMQPTSFFNVMIKL